MAGPKTIIIEGGQSYTASVQLEAERAATVSDTLTYQADDYQGSQGSIEVTAAPFALVGGGRFYQFEDQTGDRVTIMVTGGGLAQVTLGATGQADIESIEFIAGTGNLPNMSSLMIMVAGGSTQLGRLAGEVNLSMLWAPQVELVGDGIEIEGDVNFLGLQRVASQARVHFAAETPAFLWIKEISEAGQIEVDGPVRLLLAEDFVGGSLRVDSLSLALVDDLDAEIEVADGGLDNLIVRQGDLNGAIQVNGSLGSVFVMRGDLLGDLNVEYDIDRIFLPSGTISGVIKSGRVIGNIYSSNMNRANVSAFDRIDRIDVQANMTESLVSVGSDVSNPSNQSAAAIRPGETYLGAIRVGGRYEASQVAVGVSPDMEGSFYPGVAGAIRGSIGTVNLSKVVFNNRENLFGIIAKDAVNSLQVNHQTIPTDYRQDDFIVAILNK